MLNPLELTGRARTHIVQLEQPRCALHADALEPFLALREVAAREGMDVQVFSSFRDFSAQASIWNRKFRGERPLYDRDGTVRDHASLDPLEIMEAILCWSAVPGASRHHWGSDLDVFDAAAMPPNYKVQLLPEEYAAGGLFAVLADWLSVNMARFGFFRPYAEYRGGVYPEPWHISYAPVSLPALELLTSEVMRAALSEDQVAGTPLLLARIEEIRSRYVANISPPPA